MATASLPNVPYKSQVTDQNGFLSSPWAGFFRELYAKLGGSQAPDLSDVSARLIILQGEITVLQSAVSILESEVSGFGLGIGPVL